VLIHFFEHGRWDSFVMGVEGQSLTGEDQLFILMQAGQYLSITRGLGAPEARICYERAESLCRSLNRPTLLYSALMGQWLCSLIADKLTAAMQIAQRIYSLAEGQNDATLIAGACRALAPTLYFMGDFEATRQYAMRGVKIWRSGDVQSHARDLDTSAVICTCYEALSEWHFGEVASSRLTIAEAISLAKELNDYYTLAPALWFAAVLSHFEGNFAEVERLASELTELSTRHSYTHYLIDAQIFRGWARSASGDTAEGISLIEDGIEDHRATGSVLAVPYLLILKAEALYLAGRTSEALEAIREAETLVGRFEGRWLCAELHRLRGVFLAAMGAEEAQIEASFREAIRTAKQQKSISLAMRAEASYAEYRSQKARV
jgi:predicted ATPase